MSAQLVREGAMLPNYDAGAVAAVLGIAFLRGSEAACAPAKRAGRGSAAAGRFLIKLDTGVVRVVEARIDKTFADFASPKEARTRELPVAGDQVCPPSSVLIEKAVENGFPRLVLRHVAERLAGGDKAKVSAVEWGVVPKTTLERRQEQLSPQESERTERVARLFVHARRALGTEAEAREFMTAPHPRLDGRSPLDAARTDLGARRTEQILNALEYGLAL